MSNCSESPASAQPPDPSLFPGMRSPPDRAPRQSVYCTSRVNRFPAAGTARPRAQPGAPAPHAPAPERALNSLLLIPREHISRARVPSLCQVGLCGSERVSSPQPHIPTVPGLQNRSGAHGGIYHWDCNEQFAVGVLPIS